MCYANNRQRYSNDEESEKRSLGCGVSMGEENVAQFKKGPEFLKNLRKSPTQFQSRPNKKETAEDSRSFPKPKTEIAIKKINGGVGYDDRFMRVRYQNDNSYFP